MIAAVITFQRGFVMPRRKSRRLALATALASLLAAVLVPGAGAVNFSGSITASDAGHADQQLPSAASSCAAPNTSNVGSLLPGAQLHYDVYTLMNQSASASCVTVSYTASSGVFIAAYSPSFNPANVGQNFLGSTQGLNEPCGGTSGSFSFTVPANASFVVEVEECVVNAGVASYSLDVTGSGVVLAARFRSLSASPTAHGTLVRWRTASELDVLGFNVYRELNGRRVRVNKRLIAAHNRGSGASYSYLDHKARKGTRYWIQAVNVDGTRSWYGPTRSAR
jgi:hypothetical protein